MHEYSDIQLWPGSSPSPHAKAGAACSITVDAKAKYYFLSLRPPSLRSAHQTQNAGTLLRTVLRVAATETGDKTICT